MSVEVIGTCCLPGCWNVFSYSTGSGRPRRYCSDDHRYQAAALRRRVDLRLRVLRDQIRRDEHLLAALGGEIIGEVIEDMPEEDE